MKISAAAAQWFSHSLLSMYAARTERELDDVLNGERANHELRLADWLVALRAEHAEHCRQRIRNESTNSGLSNLTRREREVLQRIATGETDAAIGRTLGISPKTASKHVENILRKLGVETRTAAVASAFDRRLVSPAARRPAS